MMSAHFQSKQIMLRVANLFSRIWQIFPGRLRRGLLTGLFILESRGKASQGLRNLFLLQDKLEWVVNERALAYGGGVHPKHRLTKYHDFFVQRIPRGSRVLDIGCGYGAVSRSIANSVPDCTVVGVDTSHARLFQARNNETPENLSFVEADATQELPQGPWNAIVLSNVLEHIEDRPGFLKSILSLANPEIVLIRVPLFERDWKVPLRRELNVNYFSDPTHYIEHTLSELEAEISASGLEQGEVISLWGEIWTECRPLVK